MRKTAFPRAAGEGERAGKRMETTEYRERCVQAAHAVTAEVKKAVKGKDAVIELVLLAMLARGHILLEDIPGVGKTTMALAFSKAMQLQYNRVQFTPDVMPSDVTGYSVYQKELGRFEYVKGAALCNLFLADEINRTSSKTQSALLQVMEEGAVTVDLKTYETPKPFTVIATQNPVGYAGTQMLPESQLDRFLVRLSMGYPDAASELAILKSKSVQDASPEIRPIVGAEGILAMQELADGVHVSDAVYQFIVALAAKTRTHELVELGASPRGAIALLRMAKAKAFYAGREFVTPADVQQIVHPALAHRLVLKAKARVANGTAAGILNDILRDTPAPKI